MSYILPENIIKKYSSKFSLAVAAVMFLASYQQSWQVSAYRVISIYIIFFCVSHVHLYLLKNNCKGENIIHLSSTRKGKKIFILGFLSTYLLVLTMHFAGIFMAKYGLLSPEYIRKELEHISPGNFYFVFLLTSFVIYFMISFLHNFIIFQEWRVQLDLENSKLKSIHADTVNELLKQQIQPHFLFNALNVLKSLIRKHPDIAEEYLISLSDFLRASVNQNKKTLATLKEELKICKDYMEMQKIRFGNAINYQVNVSEKDNVYLPVFSLQPLLENAIKHNELTQAAPLIITLSEKDGWIEVSNTSQPRKILLESTGNGLSNLSERYKIIANQEIEIEEIDNYFKVRVKLLPGDSLLHKTSSL